MSVFGNLFGGKKKKEKEKREYIDKLLPYKQYIENFNDFCSELMEYDIDVIKHNVDKNIKDLKRIDFENYLEDKYGDEVGKKIYLEDLFYDMSEEQFDDHIKYQIIVGKIQGLYRGEDNERVNPFYIRKEDSLKTKTKVVRTNTRKRVSYKEEYIFENDKLVQIKKYK